MYDRYGNYIGEQATILGTIGNGLYWLLIGLLVLLFIRWLFTFIVVTPGKHAKILETFGRPHAHARLPGLGLKMPWPITAVVASMNLQLQEISANVNIKTKDNAFMDLPVKVQYRVNDSADATAPVLAHYELKDHEQQIKSYVLNQVRQSVSTMEMAELYQNRNNIEADVQTQLQDRFSRYGFVIENVLIDEPQPSSEVKAAFNHVIASQRAKEAAQNEADAARIKLVGFAEAEKQSKKLQGEGMADMRKAIAHGIEDSVKQMTGSGMTHEQALALLMDTNRLDTINSAATHGNLVIVDMKSPNDVFTNALVGTRAGLAEGSGNVTALPSSKTAA